MLTTAAEARDFIDLRDFRKSAVLMQTRLCMGMLRDSNVLDLRRFLLVSKRERKDSFNVLDQSLD